MKRVIEASVLVILAISLWSCAAMNPRVPITTTTPGNNKTYEVEYLFEHVGCKVYRFMDYGNYVYFTNCNGDVTSIANDSISTRVINVNKVAK